MRYYGKMVREADASVRWPIRRIDFSNHQSYILFQRPRYQRSGKRQRVWANIICHAP